MNIGIIGMGNMGSAIGTKLAENNYSLYINNRSMEKLEKFKSFENVHLQIDKIEVVKNSDLLILALKPKDYTTVMKELKPYFKKDAIFMSIAAGITIESMESVLGERKIVRTMPNTGALIGKSMTAICPNKYINKEDLDFVEKVVNSFGRSAIIEESKMDAFSGACGCLPAYVYMFIEAAADGAVLQGLSREESYQYIAQSVLGAAAMVLETKLHPAQLKDGVTSPGGSTIEGVKALEDLGFRSAVINALNTSIEKNRAMGE